MLSEQDTIQTIAWVSTNFQITLDMLQMGKGIDQTQLNDLVHVELVLERIPTKEL
jgi:hypothetical protein